MPDERLPNYARSAIDRLIDELGDDFRMELLDWFAARRPQKDIAEELRERGHQISESQISRWHRKYRSEVERVKRTTERATVLAKHLVPDGVTVEDGTVKLIHAICFEALADADIPHATTIADLAKIAQSVARTQTSAVGREKWEQEKRKKIAAAVALLKEEVQKLLEDKPELIRDLFNVIDAAKAQMTEKAA